MVGWVIVYRITMIMRHGNVHEQNGHWFRFWWSDHGDAHCWGDFMGKTPWLWLDSHQNHCTSNHSNHWFLTLRIFGCAWSHSTLFPLTRLLMQVAYATCCYLHSTDSNCLCVFVTVVCLKVSNIAPAIPTNSHNCLIKLFLRWPFQCVNPSFSQMLMHPEICCSPIDNNTLVMAFLYGQVRRRSHSLTAPRASLARRGSDAGRIASAVATSVAPTVPVGEPWWRQRSAMVNLHARWCPSSLATVSCFITLTTKDVRC